MPRYTAAGGGGRREEEGKKNTVQDDIPPHAPVQYFFCFLPGDYVYNIPRDVSTRRRGVKKFAPSTIVSIGAHIARHDEPKKRVPRPLVRNGNAIQCRLADADWSGRPGR